MPDKCSPRWGVYVFDPKEGGNLPYPIAAFTHSKDAWEWIDDKKSKYFFTCESMEEAERVWGRHRFRVERTAVYSRKDTAKHLHQHFDQWPE